MSSIGELLREARKKKGLSEEVAAKAVKIKVDRLRALEEGRYEEFPAQVYARSFLRQYADYLKVDISTLLQSFAETNPPGPQKAIFDITEEQRSAPLRRQTPTQPPMFSLTSTGRTVLVALVMIILVVAACVWWIIKNPSQASTPVVPTATSSLPPSVSPATSLHTPAPGETTAATPVENWQSPPTPPLMREPLNLSTNLPGFEVHRPQ